MQLTFTRKRNQQDDGDVYYILVAAVILTAGEQQALTDYGLFPLSAALDTLPQGIEMGEEHESINELFDEGISFHSADVRHLKTVEHHLHQALGELITYWVVAHDFTGEYTTEVRPGAIVR